MYLNMMGMCENVTNCNFCVMYYLNRCIYMYNFTIGVISLSVDKKKYSFESAELRVKVKISTAVSVLS